MTRLWNWDFEDEPARRRPRFPPSPPPDASGTGVSPGAAAAAGAPGATAAPDPPRPHPAPSHAQLVRFRRRRGGAMLLVAVLAALIAAAVSTHGHSSATNGKSQHPGALTPRARLRTPTEPENDQTAAVSSVLAYTPFVKTGSARAREVALTFDDGPGPYTPQVLSVLEHYHVHATFFVIGKMLRYFAPSAVREIEDGDVIGDHTETHPFMAQLSAHEQHEELFEQIARVELLGGKRPDLFRPPYGSFNATTLHELHALHLLMVLWSVDTGDYLQPGVPAIVERALAGAQPGGIILMHDAGGTRTETIEALPKVIEGLRARGYRLVTVPQLLADDPPTPGQPLPPNLSGD